MESLDILTYLKDNLNTFSKRQILIATYILENYDKAAYMTAAVLSETIGVSESTVVRFASEIGFDGYPQMQKRLRQLTVTQSNSLKRMEIASRHLDDENILSSVLKSDVRMIEHTLEEIDKQQFDSAVNAILNAKNIYITGIRSAASLASFTDFYFRLMFDNTKLISSADASDMFEQAMHINENDVIIGMSFPRYSKNIIKLLEYASKRGATVIGITDSQTSPIVRIADYSLTAKSDINSFVDSLVAPFSVVNALIAALGMKQSEYIKKNFEDLENIWEEYGVYDKE
ncbi:MAG: MurR/RpiR family transcriptional regulator [Clostridia bacterium]|nr:MurR/RpiR family transcriptional regulator [Clostridia bacterium]